MDVHMDYSNYNPFHPKFTMENKAKLGKFKNELGSDKKCVRFVGLRAKCYSLKLTDKKHEKSEKCKRYLLSCGIHSYGYGHYLIKKHDDKCFQCKK